METYRALILRNEDGQGTAAYEPVMAKPLEEGELRVQVQFSGINYKDRLAMNPKTRVVRQYPMVPGIDFSGVVKETRSSRFLVGDQVFLTGFGFGTDTWGGYREQVEVHESFVCKIPSAMTAKEAMILGTGGLTAALSVHALGELKAPAKILVTGGTGGVASHAILILKALGHHVTAVTRNPAHDGYLRSLGADEVILHSTLLEPRKPLSKETWDGVVDAAGGEALGNILTEVRYGAVVAASGNLAGASFQSTVFPFILRGVTLKGIDSVQAPRELKEKLFGLLATSWKSAHLEDTLRQEVLFGKVLEVLQNEPQGAGKDLIVFE